MKKLIIIPFLLISLCGCGEVKELSADVEINSDLQYDSSEEEYINQFAYRGESDIVEKFSPEKTATEVNKLSKLNISLTQKGQPIEEVKIYENTDMDLLIATDGSTYEVYNGNVGIPRSYSDLINNFIENKWHFTGSTTGAQLNRLDFGNNEYLLSNNDFSYFSLSYDNVSLNSDNTPLGISLFIDNNNVTKLYIKYYDLPYINKDLSVDNINMLRYALTMAGISDTDIIINKFQNFIKSGKNVNTNISQYKINCIKPTESSMNMGAMVITIK